MPRIPRVQTTWEFTIVGRESGHSKKEEGRVKNEEEFGEGWVGSVDPIPLAPLKRGNRNRNAFQSPPFKGDLGGSGLGNQRNNFLSITITK
jgi:hypothetical protein